MTAIQSSSVPRAERRVSDRLVLACRDRVLDCRPGSRPYLMGILNATPDSFSDGGRYATLEAALRRASEMISEGADIIDVGGESTRPRGGTYGAGASRISSSEEMDRVLPVVEAIRREFPQALISIDTYKGEVARAALRAGAHIVNDVTGCRHGTGTARAAADFRATLVLMHSLGRPGDMPHEFRYGDVVEEVAGGLKASIAAAREAGAEHLVIDPGFGFGKSVRDNLRLIGHIDRFVALGYPVLVGVSRKSTVGAILGSPSEPTAVEDRLFGTLGLTALAVIRGASIVRTHDVGPTRELLLLLHEASRASHREGPR